MKKLLGNWEIKVLAVLAAIIFWFLVVATENTFYTYPEEISVKAFNLPENLVVAEELGTVKLRLKINNRDTIKNLTIDDFSAYVDLEGATVGERQVDIEVSSKKSDINVVKVDPSSIKVKIEEKAEKEVPIEYEVINNPKDGFVVKDVSISSERIIIKGSQEVLNDINSASLLLDLKGLSDNITAKFKVAVLDDQGEKIQGITPEKEELEATVKISAVKDQKIAGVQPTIIGTPKDNIWIKSITVEPNYIVLNGESDKLTTLDFVKTTDIDVSGISNDSTFDVQVTGLPEGVSVEGNNNVKVNIKVEITESSNISGLRKTFTLPVLVRKFNSDQKSISIDPMTVTLVVEGEEKIISDISSKLNVELDISGYEGNEAVVDVTENNIDLPAGVKVVSITPSKVEITWE
jgi:YbbR domain-containing protein